MQWVIYNDFKVYDLRVFKSVFFSSSATLGVIVQDRSLKVRSHAVLDLSSFSDAFLSYIKTLVSFPLQLGCMTNQGTNIAAHLMKYTFSIAISKTLTMF